MGVITKVSLFKIMNRIRHIAFLLSALLTISCFNERQPVLPATTLSFDKFVIGGSFNEGFEEAINNSRIRGLKHRKEGLLDIAEFTDMEIQNYEQPDTTLSLLQGEIKSYKDTIYSIKFLSFNDNAIFGMYQAKYGDIEPRNHTFVMNDCRYYIKSCSWAFENGEVFIKKTEWEPISPISTLGYHYEGVLVHYSDKTISPIALEYEEIMSEKTDSLKHAEKARERIQKALEEQERANIIKAQQREILKTLSF